MIKTTGILGMLAFTLFTVALIVFGFLNQEFNFSGDFISKLEARGEPYAIWWNIIGFGIVGSLLFGFGITYGKIIHDAIVGILLSMFGLGLALASIPIDMAKSDSPVTKAHVVAICLALAFWLFGLARMGYKQSLGKSIRFRANVAATLLAASMIGFALGFWSMPVTHRLVFSAVFGWTALTSTNLLLHGGLTKSNA